MIEEHPDRERFEIHPFGRGVSRLEVAIAAGAGGAALIAGVIAAKYVGVLIAIGLFWVPLALILLIAWSVRKLATRTLLVGDGLLELRGARGAEFAVRVPEIEFIGLGQPTFHSPRGRTVYIRGSDAEGDRFEVQIPSGMAHLPRFLRLLRDTLGSRALAGPVARIVMGYPEARPAWADGFAAIAATASARQGLLADEGRRRIADSDYPGAIKSLKRAVRLYGRDAEAMSMLADALLLSGRLKPAAAWYARSVSLNPGAPGTNMGLSIAKYLTGDYGSSQRTLSRGFASGEDGEITRSLQACSMMMNSDFGGARRLFCGLAEGSKNAAMRKMASTCLNCVANNEEYTTRLQSDERFRKKEAAKGTAGKALKAWAAMIYGALSIVSPIISRLFKSGKVAAALGMVLLMATAVLGAVLWRKPGGPTAALRRDEAAMCWTWLGPNTPLRQVVYKEYFRKPKAAGTPTSRTIYGAANQGKTE